MTYFVGLAGSDISSKMPIAKMKKHIVPLNKFSAKMTAFFAFCTLVDPRHLNSQTQIRPLDHYKSTSLQVPEDDKVLFQLAFDQIYREYVSASPSLCLLKETLRPIIWIK